MYPNIFLSMSAELPNKFKINTQYTYQKMGAYLVAGHLGYVVCQYYKKRIFVSIKILPESAVVLECGLSIFVAVDHP